jgi:hypothetical protein
LDRFLERELLDFEFLELFEELLGLELFELLDLELLEELLELFERFLELFEELFPEEEDEEEAEAEVDDAEPPLREEAVSIGLDAEERESTVESMAGSGMAELGSTTELGTPT